MLVVLVMMVVVCMDEEKEKELLCVYTMVLVHTHTQYVYKAENSIIMHTQFPHPITHISPTQNTRSTPRPKICGVVSQTA